MQMNYCFDTGNNLQMKRNRRQIKQNTMKKKEQRKKRDI